MTPVRNERTKESKSFWQRAEKAAITAPEWVKKNVGESNMGSPQQTKLEDEIKMEDNQENQLKEFILKSATELVEAGVFDQYFKDKFHLVDKIYGAELTQKQLDNLESKIDVALKEVKTGLILTNTGPFIGTGFKK